MVTVTILYPEVTFFFSNFNFYYHSVDILPGAVMLLKDNQLKKQEITLNTEQLKGRKFP